MAPEWLIAGSTNTPTQNNIFYVLFERLKEPSDISVSHKVSHGIKSI